MIIILTVRSAIESSSCCQTKTSSGEIIFCSTCCFTTLPQASQFKLLSNAAQLDSQYLSIDTAMCYIMGIHNIPCFAYNPRNVIVAMIGNDNYTICCL